MKLNTKTKKSEAKFEPVPLPPPFLLNNVKLTYQDVGTNWIIIMEGGKQDIEYAFYSFYNLGATNAPEGLTWGTDNVAWFWTTPYRLKKYFASRYTAIHLNEGKNESFVSGILAQRYSKEMMKKMQKTPCNFHFGKEIACYTVAEYCEQNNSDDIEAWKECAYREGIERAEKEIRELS